MEVMYNTITKLIQRTYDNAKSITGLHEDINKLYREMANMFKSVLDVIVNHNKNFDYTWKQIDDIHTYINAIHKHLFPQHDVIPFQKKEPFKNKPQALREYEVIFNSLMANEGKKEN